jgi:hypothetical protein
MDEKSKLMSDMIGSLDILRAELMCFQTLIGADASQADITNVTLNTDSFLSAFHVMYEKWRIAHDLKYVKTLPSHRDKFTYRVL